MNEDPHDINWAQRLLNDPNVYTYIRPSGRVKVKFFGQFLPLAKIVYVMYFGPVPPGHVVHHVDLSRDNDRASNLEPQPKGAVHQRLHGVLKCPPGCACGKHAPQRRNKSPLSRVSTVDSTVSELHDSGANLGKTDGG